MKLYSTNNKDLRVSFQEAVFNSMPQDKGLYMPLEIPKLDQEFIDNIDKYSLPEIAYQIASTLLKDEIPADDLKALVEDAANFDAPVVKLSDDTFVLELFHGPSLAFKDFGARFMSRVMAYFLKDGEQLLDVLVATSGDTGGAVALGFLGVPNTRVTILFPKGKVSEVQRLQLTTNGQNIRAIAVDGTFDDWKTEPIKFQLKPGTTPYHGRAFPIPHIHLETLKKEVARLVKLGVLVKQPFSQWGAPTFIIPKKNGQVRVISDFREVNKWIIWTPYPIPKISTMLQDMEGFTYATSLDLNMGYYTIRLDPDAQKICTIVLPWGNICTCICL